MLTTPFDPYDRDIVGRIASRFGAMTEEIEDNPHRLLEMLRDGQVYVPAGDIPDDTTFADLVAISDPIGKLAVGRKDRDCELARRRGENRFIIEVNRAIRGRDE